MATKIKQEDRETEEDRKEQALHQLAVLGGKLLGEDDVTFKGTKFVLPEHLELGEAIDFLEQRRDDEEQQHDFSRTFNYRPHDGARATAIAVRQAFGFTLGKTLWSFFGRSAPALIDIETGPNGEREQVPWGAMRIPGLQGVTLHLGSTRSKEYGQVFHITVEAPRKYRFHIEGLFRLIEETLRNDSIYRGKAMDGDGKFIDTAVIDPTNLVYTDSVYRRLDGDLWSFIKYEHQLAEYAQGGKYAVLLEGPYGSGKTEAAGITAQIANDHGWTFLMCRPGKDSLEEALQMARLYPPAVVFAEDVDVRAAAGAFDINQSLDMMDGFHTKGQKLIAVFTTNNAERIHAGMLRPGRIGAVIHVGAMDRAGIEKLARRVIGDGLDKDVDFDAVAVAMEGYMPAFVKEAFNRSVRYSIARNHGTLGTITTMELLDAADGLRDQLALMQAAKSEGEPDTVGECIANAVGVMLKGAELQDDDGDAKLWLHPALNGSGG